jgi:hypothetical protein
MKNFLTAIVLLFIGISPASAQLQKNKHYTFQALIGKSTKAQLWLTQTDDIVIGEIEYSKGKRPIALRGIEEDGLFRILEFSPDGTITGIITGKLKNNQFSGEWFSPKSRKSLAIGFKLQEPTTLKGASLLTQSYSGGTYTYSYGKDAHQGYLNVKRISADSAMIEVSNLTAAPAYNQATIEPSTVSVTNNQVIYNVLQGCTIRIRFYSDFAVIDYVNKESDCLFGMNATVDGVYWKRK